MCMKIHPMFEDILDDQVLHPEGIAQNLGVHVSTVRRWCKEGKLPCYNIAGQYLVTGDDFKKFMRKARVRTKAQKELLGDE